MVHFALMLKSVPIWLKIFYTHLDVIPPHYRITDTYKQLKNKQGICIAEGAAIVSIIRAKAAPTINLSMRVAKQ
jgi:hypothetical protein